MYSQNKIILIFAIFLTFSLSSFTAFAESYENVTLEKLIEISLNNNLTLKSKQLDKKMYEAQVDEVTATGLPQININSQVDDNLIIPTTLIPASISGGPADLFIPVQFGTQFNMSATAVVEQMIYNHSFWTGLKAAKASSDFADITVNMTKEQIVYNVSTLYYNINITNKAIQNIKENLKKLNETLKIMEAQEANGFITKVDVKRVKVAITNLESELSNINTSLDNMHNILKVQLNLPMETQLTLDNVINEQEILKEIELSSNPYSNRTELLLLNKQSELYELQKDNINSGYYPSVNAYGRYSYQAFRQSFDFFDGDKDWFKMAVIGVSIRIPVFDGFGKKYRAEQSEVKIQQTQFETQLLKENVNSEIKNAKAKLKTSIEQFNSQKANILLAEDVYKQTEQRYKEGLSPITDLLNAETALKESQNNYLRSLLQINLAKLDLKKAEGTLIK